jgi:thymidylate kinase
VIIIDGPDGAGKTTLGHQLEAGGYTYLQSPRLAAKGNADRMKYETSRYLRLYGISPVHVVDRMLFSEEAYGPVLRGRSAFSRFEYLYALSDIMSKRVIVVFCLPQHYHYKIEESPLLIAQMPKIKERYEELFDKISAVYPRIIKYDWQLPDAYDKLKRFIGEQGEKHKCLDNGFRKNNS